jgi:murein DD-endopeptidase MepM/ murein hydrolase activator NlpD
LKDKRLWFYIVCNVVLVAFIVSYLPYLNNVAQLNHLIDYKKTKENIRILEMKANLYNKFKKWEAEGSYNRYDYMAAYFITSDTSKETLDRMIPLFREYQHEIYSELTGYLTAVWADVVYFPIPDSTISSTPAVVYENSWMYERTYGGERGHEGTDVMATKNQRGIYPVISMTDGTVEKIGWLPKGGYRIGIRSPHGGYFYYAHLFDYADDFKPGTPIKAGQLLGFMGDSGYSEIEGTVGKFDVHLHLGVYVNDITDNGVNELSLNSYWLLKYFENKKITYNYQY